MSALLLLFQNISKDEVLARWAALNGHSIPSARYRRPRREQPPTAGAAASAESVTAETPAAAAAAAAAAAVASGGDSAPPHHKTAYYQSIPATFSSLATHPERTNLLCWNCSLSFSSYPRFVAKNVARVADDDTKIWNIEGNFCSWACAAAYIADKYPQKSWDYMQNIAIIRAQITGLRVERVIPAPPKTLMKMYCGDCGIFQEEFENELGTEESGRR